MARKAPAQLDFGLVVTDPEAHRRELGKKGRKCLSCSRTFQSTGPGNRTCGSCKEPEAWTSPTACAVHAAL